MTFFKGIPSAFVRQIGTWDAFDKLFTAADCGVSVGFGESLLRKLQIYLHSHQKLGMKVNL
jgi:hypothetical protein